MTNSLVAQRFEDELAKVQQELDEAGLDAAAAAVEAAVERLALPQKAEATGRTDPQP